MRTAGSNLVVAALLLGALAATAATTEIPETLRVPAGQTLFLQAQASGVQIYECASKPDTGYLWAFKAPEATLADAGGKALGKHFAGPTWQGNDGSSVVGELKAKDPGPSANAIPWLLLSAKSTSGNGAFTATKSIQRIATAGGISPTTTCSEKNAGQVERVPYTATYNFYR